LRNKKIFLVLTAIFSLLQSINGEVSLTTSVNKNQLTIGDIVRYQVIFTYNENIKIDLPSIGGNLGGFEIKNFEDKPAYQNEKKEWIKEYNYDITTFFTGIFIIPALDFPYMDEKNEKVVLKSDEHRLEVLSLTTEGDQDIRDIKPPMEIPYDYTYWIIAGISAALLGAALFIYLRFFRKKDSLKAKRQIPHENPYEWAMRIFEYAEKELMEEDRFCKEFYFQLSYALRGYLESKYQISALEMTSDELMKELKIYPKGFERLKELGDFLTESDFVKFAKSFFNYDTRHSDLQWLKNWITENETSRLIDNDAEYQIDNQEKDISKELKIEQVTQGADQNED